MKLYTKTGRRMELNSEQARGRRVRLVQYTQNGFCRIPEGKILWIEYIERGKLVLTAKRCDCCEITASVSGVEASSVVLLDDEPPTRQKKKRKPGEWRRPL